MIVFSIYGSLQTLSYENNHMTAVILFFRFLKSHFVASGRIKMKIDIV